MFQPAEIRAGWSGVDCASVGGSGSLVCLAELESECLAWQMLNARDGSRDG